MGRLTKGEFSMAVRMLQRNRGRSLLTMLGIIIGVAAVVTIVGIGNGVTQQVSDQTEHLGRDLITVRPGQLTTAASTGGFGVLSSLSGVQAGGILSPRDVTSIVHAPGVASAVPLSLVSDGVTSDENHQHFAMPVIGTDPGFPAIVNQTLAFGGFLDPDNAVDDKVVLGSHAAQALFDENVPLGQTVTILGQQFIVSGIFNDFQTVPLAIDVDFNDAVFIANTEAQTLTNNNARIYEVLARPAKIDQTNAVVHQLDAMLLKAHGGQHDFTVLKQSQTIMVANAILELLTALTIGVAAIALLVGGVGIMNIMLVSVTERMHEIGIRKAIGATNRQILWQFVIEAAVLSVVGALVGVLLSFALEIGLRLVTNLTPDITWEVAVVSCAVSIVVGVLFGSIPALKAARKDPIAALRNE